MRNILLIGLAGFAGWYYYRRYQLAQRIKIVLRQIKISGGNVLNPKITVGLGIQNPTGTKTNIGSIVGTISVNNRPIADVTNFTNYVIEGNQETRINVDATVKLGSVVSELIKLLSGKKKNITVNFSGTVNAENISIPVNSNYKF